MDDVDKFMLIDCEAMRSLDLLNYENAEFWKTKSKDQVSCLFDILNQCRSPQGKFLMRQWFLRPLVLVGEITDRQNAVAFCLLQQNEPVLDAILSHLTKLKNIPTMITRLRVGNTRTSDWEAILQSCHHAIAIYAQMQQSLFEKGHLLESIMQGIDVTSLHSVTEQINATIDFAESVAKERNVIKHDVDSELDNMKRMYAGIEPLLSEVCQRISTTLTNDTPGLLNVVYIPRFGFLLSAPVEYTHNIASTHACTALCSNEGFSYYKTDHMRELDDKLGDLHSLITERELDVVQKLQESVLERTAQLIKASEVLAELDCILALATAAKKNHYQRPILTNSKEVEVVRGRHPVYAHNVTNFVENDVKMCVNSNQDDAIIVVTGANYSGKSVYTKQIAVFCFMAQIGSFVSAESARLGIVDRIFTRIQTREASSKAESAFAYDVHQAIDALEMSTASSMIVLDEFGKGTKTTDGAALFVGVLRHLMARGRDCPRVLVATHFLEALNDVHLPPSLSNDAKIAYFKMTLMDNEEVTLLYKLVRGKCTEALGLKLAEKLELFDDELLARAAQRVGWFVTDGETGWLEKELKCMKEESLLVQAYEAFSRCNLAESGEIRDRLSRLLIDERCTS